MNSVLELSNKIMSCFGVSLACRATPQRGFYRMLKYSPTSASPRRSPKGAKSAESISTSEPLGSAPTRSQDVTRLERPESAMELNRSVDLLRVQMLKRIRTGRHSYTQQMRLLCVYAVLGSSEKGDSHTT